LKAVVTGVGAVASIGRNAGAFLESLRDGRSGIRATDLEERRRTGAAEVARIDGWSPQPEIPAMKARRLDRGSQFAVVASLEAARTSQFPVAERAEDVGIVLGTGSAGAGALTEFVRVLLEESPEAAPPFHFPNTIANAPASQVSLEMKFHGPNVTITQKDPSALNALIYAVGCLEAERAEAMIAGGVDEWNAVYAWAMGQMRALRGPGRPSGIVQGEGCFVVFLEEEGRARARGGPILARVAGFAFASSPSAPYRFAADEAAAQRAICGALLSAGVSADEIDLVLPSRSGRAAIDDLESRLLDRLLGSGRAEVVCVKEAVGEMAAAGGAQLVAAAMRLAEPGGPRKALVNSFGVGGNFAAAVLERP
jgi:3-oxoacyl-[acyl-carrier-protein] synthase II